MKTILSLLFLSISLSAQGALVLNAGESYSYHFSNLLANGYAPYGTGCPGIHFSLGTLANLGLESGDSLRFEIFSGAPTGTPVYSNTITTASGTPDFFPSDCGIWSDLEGSFRLTAITGSAAINLIQFYISRSLVNGAQLFQVAVYPQNQPTLRLTPSPTALVLRWPTSSVNFTLESRPILAGATNWQVVTNAVQTNNGNCSVTVGYQASPRFFRLRYP